MSGPRSGASTLSSYLPVAREDTDLWPVFTMPDFERFRDVLAPVVEQAIAPIKRPGGVVTRLALVRLQAGAHIAPHVDGHAMAEKAHRIHVSLSSTPSVEYKIGGRRFTMLMGHAYDFNNRVRHSVRNKGRRSRVNLFVDYYPNPGHRGAESAERRSSALRTPDPRPQLTTPFGRGAPARA